MKALDFRKALTIVAALAVTIGAQTVWDGVTSWTGNTPNQAKILAGCVIDKPELLAELAFLVNKGNTMSGKTFTLAGDIALNNTEQAGWQRGANEWIAIGDETHPFRGTFKGGGFVVRGVYITKSGDSFQGLFGNVKKPGAIEKLRVAESDISGNRFVGGLVGADSGAAITDCYSTAKVTGTGDNVGGLVGYMDKGTISSSYATGDVTGKDSVGGLLGAGLRDTIRGGYATGSVTGVEYVGGLVGVSAGNGYTINAYAAGKIVKGTRYVGGLVGRSSANIVNSYDSGSVTGSSYVGGLAGVKDGAAMKNCYTAAEVNKGILSPADNVGALAGIVNDATITYCYYNGDFYGTIPNSSGLGIPKGADDMIGNKDFVSLLNVAAYALKNNTYKENTNKWFYSTDQYPRLSIDSVTAAIFATCFGGGSGEENNPYRIDTLQHLENLAVYVNCGADLSKKGYFKLTKDINLNPADPDPAWRNWKSGDKKLKAWTPIGQQPNDTVNQAKVRFNGTFDGDGHTIYGVYIDKGSIADKDTTFASRYQGLFGRVEKEGTSPGGVIKNLGVSGVFIQGYCYTGVLAGWVNKGGAVIKCTVRGANVRATGGKNGAGGIGGLVGLSDGGSLIINSSSTANVEGEINMAGGLVGWNSGNSRIAYSYAQGKVSVTGDDVGGLVGRNDGSTVRNCYATGNVSAANDLSGKGGHVIGGLVGMNFNATVTKSYAVGTVGGNSSVGGLVGSRMSGGRVDSSYYRIDAEKSNINDFGTAKSDREMRDSVTYAGWDFKNVWAFGTDFDHEVQSFPYLGMIRTAAPEITRSPKGAWVDVGAKAVLSVEARAAGGVLSYQWYSNTDHQNGDATKTIIDGANEASYSAPTGTESITYYYAVVTNTSTATQREVPDSLAGSRTASVASGLAKVRVGDIEDAVLSPERVIPEQSARLESVSITVPAALTAEFKAAPNPVGASRATPVQFFHKGKPVNNAELWIYDATGNAVKKIKKGSWDLTDEKGRPVSKGTYLVKGVIAGKDGKREKVSVAVRL